MSAATAAFLGSGRRIAGDGCTADHCQPGLRLAAELDPIADAGAGDPGFCNGPDSDIALLRPARRSDHRRAVVKTTNAAVLAAARRPDRFAAGSRPLANRFVSFFFCALRE